MLNKLTKKIKVAMLFGVICLLFSGCVRATEYTGDLETPDISILINGTEYTEEDFSDLTVYTCEVTCENRYGTVETSTYIGYKLADVVEKVEIDDVDAVTGATVTCADGYMIFLTQEEVFASTTLVAFYKNEKEPTEEGAVYIAPCSSDETPNYAKIATEIVIS